MKFGLCNQTIIQIQNVLSHFSDVQKAIIYGSRAKGNYRNGSDIDLTLIAVDDRALGLTQMNQIDLALDDLLLPYSFDLSELSTIENPSLLDHIERVGIVFYQKQ